MDHQCELPQGPQSVKPSIHRAVILSLLPMVVSPMDSIKARPLEHKWLFVLEREKVGMRVGINKTLTSLVSSHVVIYTTDPSVVSERLLHEQQLSLDLR